MKKPLIFAAVALSSTLTINAAYAARDYITVV
ncbi:MAG: hypothetical protein ACI9J5_001925, partial [Paraglaciecola sp.]